MLQHDKQVFDAFTLRIGMDDNENIEPMSVLPLYTSLTIKGQHHAYKNYWASESCTACFSRFIFTTPKANQVFAALKEFWTITWIVHRLLYPLIVGAGSGRGNKSMCDPLMVTQFLVTDGGRGKPMRV